jgi:hypothetical protein
MNTEEIAVEIESEISRLRQVKALLTGTGPNGNQDLGRPTASLSSSAGTRRTMSAEARERIAAAQRARWAKSKRAEKATRAVSASAPKNAPIRGLPAKKTKKRSLSAGARAKIAAAQKGPVGESENGSKKTEAAIASKKSAATKKTASKKKAVAQRAQASVAAAVPATSDTLAS